MATKYTFTVAEYAVHTIAVVAEEAQPDGGWLTIENFQVHPGQTRDIEVGPGRRTVATEMPI